MFVLINRLNKCNTTIMYTIYPQMTNPPHGFMVIGKIQQISGNYEMFHETLVGNVFLLYHGTIYQF